MRVPALPDAGRRVVGLWPFNGGDRCAVAPFRPAAARRRIWSLYEPTAVQMPSNVHDTPLRPAPWVPGIRRVPERPTGNPGAVGELLEEPDDLTGLQAHLPDGLADRRRTKRPRAVRTSCRPCPTRREGVRPLPSTTRPRNPAGGTERKQAGRSRSGNSRLRHTTRRPHTTHSTAIHFLIRRRRRGLRCGLRAPRPVGLGLEQAESVHHSGSWPCSHPLPRRPARVGQSTDCRNEPKLDPVAASGGTGASWSVQRPPDNVSMRPCCVPRDHVVADGDTHTHGVARHCVQAGRGWRVGIGGNRSLQRRSTSRRFRRPAGRGSRYSPCSTRLRRKRRPTRRTPRTRCRWGSSPVCRAPPAKSTRRRSSPTWARLHPPVRRRRDHRAHLPRGAAQRAP